MDVSTVPLFLVLVYEHERTNQLKRVAQNTSSKYPPKQPPMQPPKQLTDGLCEILDSGLSGAFAKKELCSSQGAYHTDDLVFYRRKVVPSLFRRISHPRQSSYARHLLSMPCILQTPPPGLYPLSTRVNREDSSKPPAGSLSSSVFHSEISNISHNQHVHGTKLLINRGYKSLITCLSKTTWHPPPQQCFDQWDSAILPSEYASKLE